MTAVRFLFRVTLRRHDLAAEVWHIKEPERLPPVLSPEEVKRVLTMATSLKARAMLTLAYGLRVAGRRGGAAASGRHRQRADDHSHRAVEGPQGPARDAAGGSPRSVAAMVEGAAARTQQRRRGRTPLAVSSPQSTTGDDPASG